MKIGLGLYREPLTPDNFRFATQAGATHIVAHLTNYFRGKDPTISRRRRRTDGWGDCSAGHALELRGARPRWLRTSVEAAGLKLAAIENFSPKFWSDILLDGPSGRADRRAEAAVRDAGRAGVPCYRLQLLDRGRLGLARGPLRARRCAFRRLRCEPSIPTLPLPDGVVWNMRYRPAIRRALHRSGVASDRAVAAACRLPGGDRARGRRSGRRAGRPSRRSAGRRSCAAPRASSTARRSTTG